MEASSFILLGGKILPKKKSLVHTTVKVDGDLKHAKGQIGRTGLVER